MTRLKFRIAEMVLAPLCLILVDGLLHLADDKPFMSEFVAGGATAALLIRGIDALRVVGHQWPEND